MKYNDILKTKNAQKWLAAGACKISQEMVALHLQTVGLYTYCDFRPLVSHSGTLSLCVSIFSTNLERKTRGKGFPNFRYKLSIPTWLHTYRL